MIIIVRFVLFPLRGKLEVPPPVRCGRRNRKISRKGLSGSRAYRNSFGELWKDLHDGTSLSTLVTELVRIPDLLRIRLGSIESVELSDELIRIIREEPKVCPISTCPYRRDLTIFLKE